MKTLLIDAFLVNIMGFQSGETDGKHEQVIQVFIESQNTLEFRFHNTENAFNRVKVWSPAYWMRLIPNICATPLTASIVEG